ncbi:hypothetical protein M8A51_11980 [Schlegelella sp. S2-27]|uniref:DUF3185 domain-containing protein n=1 Tax=Caldimonas mangrovi TaxID=2944811 RepID=A0ABT0YNL9_9BURK|nr:hypothetical protein [Caldimonas mangrovi]MCM5680248.1 hypothetical protein [Caldimonas mangrovi]
MKTVLAVVGAALIVLGGVILFNGLSFSSNETVFQLGEFKAQVQTEKRLPTWSGGLALAAGVVLLVVGLKK